MTREEHLEFCQRCLNRKFDLQHGIVCGLTGQIAAFEKECKDFRHDTSVVIHVDNENLLNEEEIKSKLPVDIYEGLRKQQDLVKAVVFGLVAAVVSAILWATITVYT